MNTTDQPRAVACIRFVRLCGVWLAFAVLFIVVQPIHGTLFCLWWIGERCGKLMSITERIGTKWQNYRLAVNKANKQLATTHHLHKHE
jgi:hypothetical protein